MYCSGCGKEIENNVQFCPKCGKQVCETPEIKSAETSRKIDIHLIISYITSPIILVLRFLLEQEVRWSPKRGGIAYDNMLTPAMKIVVGIVAISLIVFSNVRIKEKGPKEKTTIAIMNVINCILSIIIIFFAY